MLRPDGTPSTRVLVAGVGNVLTGDDGFGVRVVERLRAGPRATGTVLVDVGIGGIHLVQELMDGYDGLVVVDAVDREGPPGTVYVLEPAVPALSDLSAGTRTALLAETHYAVPARALTLARALDVLPPPDRVRIVGCQPAAFELGIGLSEPVAAAVSIAARRIREIVASWLSEAAHGVGVAAPAGGRRHA